MGRMGLEDRSEPARTRGGFSSLMMRETWRDEPYRGYVQAKVEPSVQIAGNSGIFVEVNYHCQLIEVDTVGGADKIVGFLSDRFASSIKLKFSFAARTIA